MRSHSDRRAGPDCVRWEAEDAQHLYEHHVGCCKRGSTRRCRAGPDSWYAGWHAEPNHTGNLGPLSIFLETPCPKNYRDESSKAGCGWYIGRESGYDIEKRDLQPCRLFSAGNGPRGQACGHASDPEMLLERGTVFQYLFKHHLAQKI